MSAHWKMVSYPGADERESSPAGFRVTENINQETYPDAACESADINSEIRGRETCPTLLP